MSVSLATRSALLLALAATAGLATGVRAQRGHATVVPHEFATADAPGLAFWALSPFAARHQVLIDASRLPPRLRGSIQRIRVRRNAAPGQDTLGGRLHVTVDVSVATILARDASPRFAENRGPAPIRVFDGLVDLPARPALTGGVPDFDGADAVTLPFVVPIAVPHQGALCIETTTRPFVDPGTGRADSPWWPIDAWTQRTEAAVQAFGRSCIPGLGDSPAGVDAASLLAGSTAVFHLGGPRSDLAPTFALGLADLTGGLLLPFDLGPLGAPGCTADILPLGIWQVPMVRLRGPNDRGLAVADVALPLASPLLGIRLGAQWWVFDPTANRLGLTSSNAVVASIAQTPPPSFAWIEAVDLDRPEGRRIRDAIPVLDLGDR